MVFKGLCLSGGGITGFVHLGVLDYLESKNLAKGITVVAGTSIGSVVGALFAIGMSSRTIFEKMVSVNHDILQYSTIQDFFTTFGMDSGEYFMAQLADIFLSNGTSPLLTFGELEKTCGKHLIITGTNVSKHSTTYFTPTSHPQMRILDAIRISISIPFLFSSVVYEKDLYVDGGISDNYPLEQCIKTVSENYPHLSNSIYCHVIGSCIESMNPRKISTIEDYIYSIFACCLKKNGKEQQEGTIYIPMTILETSSVEFDADVSKRTNMFQLGKRAADEFIDEKLYVRRAHLYEKTSVNTKQRKHQRSLSI